MDGLHRHLLACALAVAFSPLALGCGPGNSRHAEPRIQTLVSTEDGSKTAAPRTLRAAYAPYFPVGVAVAPHHLASVSDIIRTHFNRLTAENDMKLGPIHPEAERWSFENADAIARFAREHGMQMTGHALVWHRMQPEWLFSGLTPGDPESVAALQSRLEAHTHTIVARYADVIDNWDVVNEAISDNPGSVYRDGGEGSKWFEIYGGEGYIVDAFRFAKEALEASTGSAEGKLYYNDYNVTLKLDKVLALVTELRDEHGIPVAGVGLQAHWNLEWPAIADIEAAIKRIRDAGFDVKISELDVSIYCADDWANSVWEPEKPFTEELELAQAERYRALFAMFREQSEAITSVTLWGVSDDATWLDNFPAANRNNHPLLFDDAHAPKRALGAILDF